MSDKDLARRARAEISFDGVNITNDVKKYFLSLAYTDNEEDEADDLELTLQDRDGIWMTRWLNDAIQAAASSPVLTTAAPAPSDTWAIGDAVVANGVPQYSSYGAGTPGSPVTNYSGTISRLNLKDGVPYPVHVGSLGWFSISQVTRAGDVAAPVQTAKATKGLRVNAKIIRENWYSDGVDVPLDCGQFELDTVKASGPPSIIIIKSSAQPFSNQIRQTKKSRAWESFSLSGIGKELAAKNGMSFLFDSSFDPRYKRKEQSSQSDIAFLSRLAHNAGLSLKITNNTIVLFDQQKFEAMPPVQTIKRGKGGGYTKYDLMTGEADRKYASCRVSYVDPGTGKVINATAYVEDYDKKAENNQQLEIYAKISSIAEGKELAEKTLRLKNKFEKSATFTFPGKPELMAGLTVMLEGWGAWDGKYIIKQSKHTVGKTGYTTQIRLRPVLGGY